MALFQLHWLEPILPKLTNFSPMSGMSLGLRRKLPPTQVVAKSAPKRLLFDFPFRDMKQHLDARARLEHRAGI